MFTDLGIGLGPFLRGMDLPTRRLALSALSVGSFVMDSPDRRLAAPPSGLRCLIVPATLTGLIGIGYTAPPLACDAMRDARETSTIGE